MNGPLKGIDLFHLVVVAAVHHPLLGGVDEVLDGLVDGVRHILVRAGDLDGAAPARREPAHGQPEKKR